MGVNYNTSVVRDGLILYLDAANKKSFIGAAKNQKLNNYNWNIGSGSCTNFNQNGSTDENERIMSDDPWGNQSIVWETRANGSGEADGGWNSINIPIDNTKLYRFSVWVRRTTATGAGTFYFGTGGGGEEVLNINDSNPSPNPYWHIRSAGYLTQNQWFLIVGHIFPTGTTTTSQHSDSGVYTIAAFPNKIENVSGNIGLDLKWAPGTTSAVHRTYHYYSADSTTRLQFVYPRIDICDGSQPSISDLIKGGESVWRDLSGNNNHHSIIARPTFSDNSFALTDLTHFSKSALSETPSMATVVMWYKTTDQEELWVRGNTNNSYYLSAAGLGGDYYHSNVGSPTNYVDTIQQTNPTPFRNNTWHMWEAKNVNFSGWSSYEWFGYPGSWRMSSGNIGAILIYNRTISDSESKQNLNAFRSRYGI